MKRSYLVAYYNDNSKIEVELMDPRNLNIRENILDFLDVRNVVWYIPFSQVKSFTVETRFS